MTRRVSRHLTFAAAMTFAVAPGTSQQAVAAVQWPAVVTIELQGDGNQQEPQWTLRPAAVATARDVQGEVTAAATVRPGLDCTSAFVPGASFTVTCEATDRPPQVGEGELERDWACDNPSVVATIGGPIPNEQVTGIVRCASTEASCKAIASVFTVTAWRGDCSGVTTGSPLPIKCEADLTGVQFDAWTVTCYGTDP